MPAKRKAAGKKAGSKKVKVEIKEGPAEKMKEAINQLKAADAGKKIHKVDGHAPAGYTVHEDFDCMLNQTNIGHNNNKYYVIQLLVNSAGKYHTWNRWGRVGESGMNKLSGHPSPDQAIKDFEKKYKDKTNNNWSERANFKPISGKYTLIEMGDGEDGSDVVDAPVIHESVDGKTLACQLDTATQELVKLIFDNDMFRDAMASLNIDVRKMPLGKLSKTQIVKGFECLEEIEDVLNKKKKGNLMELSSKFYTVIPHDFGRTVPPKIADLPALQAKLDMLTVLGDIELAQCMQKEKENCVKMEDLEPHPLDMSYDLLKCHLFHIKSSSPKYKMIDNYLKKTGNSHRQPKIINIWEVDRMLEGDQFKAHDGIENRKLLWHGTNIAVVAAILKSGLRIMPHSGGRVGKGIYFASENSKSAAYVCPTFSGVGIMFLNEVALGNEYSVTQGDGSLTKAPKGYDSIVARGCTEPDAKLDTKVDLGGHHVVVPQGRPIKTEYHSKSAFSQSEYLIYKENQCRIRFLLKMQF